jgi:hypothetical protein
MTELNAVNLLVSIDTLVNAEAYGVDCIKKGKTFIFPFRCPKWMVFKTVYSGIDSIGPDLYLNSANEEE